MPTPIVALVRGVERERSAVAASLSVGIVGELQPFVEYRNVGPQIRVEGLLHSLGAVDGLILSGRSGVEASMREAVLARLAAVAVEHERRLTNLEIREHYLTKLFAFARLREAAGRGSIHALIRFHSEHKLLLLAYDQTRLRLMGRLLAAWSRGPIGELMSEYREHFGRALAQPPRSSAVVNVFEHAVGYFKRELDASDKLGFRGMLEAYRGGRLPASAVSSVLRTWIGRYGDEYLASQAFFQPFPEELASVTVRH